MNAWPIRNTDTRRHSMFQRTVIFSIFQLIKNPDVSITTKSLPLYSKIKRTSNKAFKTKENNIQSNKSKQTTLKKNNSIYLCTRQKENKRRCGPSLKNLQPNELTG